jgi:streptogramin lyase
VDASILGSNEYFARQGSGNIPYVQALYRDVLGREADSAGLEAHVAALARGATRTEVAFGFLTSVERGTQVAGEAYREVLGREGTEAELGMWAGVLARAPGGSAAVWASVAGSTEGTENLSAPSAVRNLQVVPTGVGSLLVTWEAPLGGGATGYSVTMNNGTSTTTSTTTATSMPFTGLSNTVPSYTFTVTGTDAAGSGQAATTTFAAQGPVISVGKSPSDLTVGQDGSIWVSNSDSNSVQQIVNTASGWIAQPAIAVGVSPTGLATAQDGSIWVANSGSNTVQQITNIGGTWTAQPAITVGSGPANLLAAADGSIWVSNYGLPQQTTPVQEGFLWAWFDKWGTGNTIQQIVNSGGVWTAQSPLNVEAGPFALASGADGSIWVSYAPAWLNFKSLNQPELNVTGQLVEALLTGTVPVYHGYGNTVQQFVNSGGSWTAQPAITVGQLPLGLTASSDGSIWVANTVGNSIQQIKNGSGGWSAQPAVLLPSTSYPSAITTGSNGSLWVTAPYVAAIQEFSMVGGVPVSQPAVDTNGIPDAIVTGADGSIWIAALTANTNMVQQFRFAPPAPTNLSATSGSIEGEMTLAWAAPPDGGASITGYTVTANQGTSSQTITTSSTSWTFSGLASGQGTTYFTVTASNFVGTSPAASLLLGLDGKPLPTTNSGVGIVTDGTPFAGGGFDGAGNAYSWEALGDAPTLGWNGVTFDLGSPNQPDFTRAAGQTIAVTQGDFNTLNLAGAGVNGNQANQQITLTFTDGSMVVWTQSFSDWTSPQNYGHEAIVSTQSYYDTATGGSSQTVNHVYGYSYTIPSGKTLASITLPTNSDVRLLDIQMSNSITVDLSNAYTSWGIANGNTQVANHQGFDGGGYYYYSGNLQSTITWSGATFNFGPVPNSNNGENNFVQGKGQTIDLPQGEFGWLYLAGASANGNQQNQAMTLTFSDGTTESWTQSFSDWCGPQNYAGESIIQMQPSWVNQVGNVHSQTNYVYGYAYQIPAGKTLVSVKLPNNQNVGILGISMV